MIDAGAGDARRLLRDAREDGATLFVGVDPVAAAMADSARRAAAKPSRGGRANVFFVVSSAEEWPPEAAGIAHRVTVRYPWGSLLRGILGRDSAVLDGIAGMLASGGRFEAIYSLTDRDGITVPATPELADAYAAAGLELTAHRPATVEEIDMSATTWGRRLAVGPKRPATRVEAVRGGRQMLD